MSRRRAICVSALMLALAAPGAAQKLVDVLENTFALETRLLDRELARYTQARRREEQTAQRMAELGRRLDTALANRSTSVEELRRLEGELAVARETASARAEESAELRRSLYARMERLAELGSEIDSERRRILVASQRLEGFWRIEIPELALTGIVRLELDGTLVDGSYRMSSGARGSIEGSFVGDRLELKRIDSGRGFDATLKGELDAAGGEIRGSWLATELGRGEATSGEWLARKLSEQEVESELQP